MADLLFMPDVLRDEGLPVREVPNWRTRGHGAMGEILGVLMHHTAGAATGDGRLADFVVPGYPSLGIVTNGRPGLDGPLCNLGLARDGTWVVVANGQAWHAGTGFAAWCGRDNGNAHLIGIEAESVGTRDDWTSQQRESYPRGVAALLRHLGLGSYRAIGHREWAPTRKVDPAFWDMNSFRADVARWTSTPAPLAPVPAPQPTEDEAMFIRYQPDPSKAPIIAVLTGSMFVGLGGGAETASALAAIKNGAVVLDVGAATWHELDKRSHALCDNPRPVEVVTPISAQAQTGASA
ncbi:MAG: N-acetylmuramoyl-L-alanine amidase [Myxococcaceae bacterium]|nr:MAG: N-acetylmuramoyl-L-alanine amidase [Myxococcaceae bacterium]